MKYITFGTSAGSTELNASRAVAATPAPPLVPRSPLTCRETFLRAELCPLLLLGTHQALHPDGHRVPVRCHASALLLNFVCLERRPAEFSVPHPYGPHTQQGGLHQPEKQLKVSKTCSPCFGMFYAPVLEPNLGK